MGSTWHLSLNSDKPNSYLCCERAHLTYWCGLKTLWTCEAVHGKWHAMDTMTQLAILFLSVVFMCATNLVLAWPDLPERGASPFHKQLSKLQQIKTLKTTEQVGRKFVSQHTARRCLHTVTLWHVLTGGQKSTLLLSSYSVEASGNISTSSYSLSGKICSGALHCAKQVIFPPVSGGEDF